MDDILVNNIFNKSEKQIKDSSKKIKKCLVVQGGGMRGTYSMAALMALEECGLSNTFDHVIGSSAGAINGAYFLANQAKLAVGVYLDDISNKNFINPYRIKKIVDIDFLVDEVLKKKKKLNLERLKNSHSSLHIILTDYSTVKAYEYTNKDKNIDLMEAIRATAALPILYNKIVSVGRGKYIDGGVVDGVPVLRAIQLGCTDILVVLTRKPSFRRKRPNFFLRNVEKIFLKNYPNKLKKKILSEDRHFNKTMDIIENYESLYKNIRIGVIYPSDLSLMVSRTTSNREQLVKCALMARNDVRKFLKLESLYDNPFG